MQENDYLIEHANLIVMQKVNEKYKKFEVVRYMTLQRSRPPLCQNLELETNGGRKLLRSTEGIILKTQDYGETHKLVTIYTKDIGKLTAISRGANKPKSRLSAVSQVFIQGEFLLYVTKGLCTLQQGQIIESHRKIREDIEKTAYAAYIVELSDRLLEEKQSDIFIYQQLVETLKWINDTDDFYVPLMMYEMKLFHKGGFAPIVRHCVNCGKNQPPYVFSILEGGILCAACAAIDPHAYKLNNAMVRLLDIFLHVEIERIGDINIKKENLKLLRHLLDSYYDRYGGYTLKSKRFLNQLEKLKE